MEAGRFGRDQIIEGLTCTAEEFPIYVIGFCRGGARADSCFREIQVGEIPL